MKSVTKTLVFLTGFAASLVPVSASAGTNGFLEHTSLTKNGLLEESLDAPTALLEDPGNEMMGQKIFPDQSALPAGVQYMFAGLWIVMLGSLPFIMPLVDQKPVTKTQIGVGVSMLCVLLGGFYLFTNIILFQSVHFSKVRPLTIIECIYFMSQVITTVGYGDITPAKFRGQVFVGLYVLGALTVIAMLISDITAHVVRMVQDYKERRSAASNSGVTDDRVWDLQTVITPEKPSVAPLLTSLACFAVIDICWVVFFSCYPGEGKTVFQALYMSVITLSTVGLGYFTPVTEAGMIFGAFWMLIGASALVSVISNFTELTVKFNAYERFKEESKAEALELLKNITKGGQEVTELQFLKFSLMTMNCVQTTQLDHIHQAFEALEPANGAVDFDAIKKTMSLETPPVSSRNLTPKAANGSD